MFRERTFRINLLPFALFLVGVALLVIEVPRVATWRQEPLTLFGSYEWTMLGSMALLATGIWAAFPQHAGPDGLRGTDGVGRYHDVRWEEIGRVSSILGFLWVRHGKKGKALMMPKFMADGFGFREYVRRNAPDGNPLKSYLLAR